MSASSLLSRQEAD